MDAMSRPVKFPVKAPPVKAPPVKAVSVQKAPEEAAPVKVRPTSIASIRAAEATTASKAASIAALRAPSLSGAAEHPTRAPEWWLAEKQRYELLLAEKQADIQQLQGQVVALQQQALQHEQQHQQQTHQMQQQHAAESQQLQAQHPAGAAAAGTDTC